MEQNILISSVGRRGYLVEYFREALGDMGRVIATDTSKMAPALYNADKWELLPRVVKQSLYIKELIRVCKKHRVSGVVSVNDQELPVLAKFKEKLAQAGVRAVISGPEAIEICFDKYKTYQVLVEAGLNTIPTFPNLIETERALSSGVLKFPIIVKPRRGSASVGISKVASLDELRLKMGGREDLLAQSWLESDEFGVDLFGNDQGEPVRVVAKKKIAMRAGETDKAISVTNRWLLSEAIKVAKKLSLTGPIDMDFLKMGRRYALLEVNPRFGGGYPLAQAVGANFPKMVIDLVEGKQLKPEKFNYSEGVVMMKQYEIVTKDLNDSK